MLLPEITEALKLLGEKLDEAVAESDLQRTAIERAAQAVAAIREYINAEEPRIAIAMLACEPIIFDDDWWDAFGKDEREHFLQTAYSIRKGLFGLEDALATVDSA
jgi:hypothetical protein